ncbi:hypothetical protein L7F22_042958 [Adiantum nelumboides]|nr:hypothetical protein [Adiantum nelumboides]
MVDSFPNDFFVSEVDRHIVLSFTFLVAYEHLAVFLETPCHGIRSSTDYVVCRYILSCQLMLSYECYIVAFSSFKYAAVFAAFVAGIALSVGLDFGAKFLVSFAESLEDREIMRVIVECCLQEKVFNKYYSLLINKLCHHDKNHRFTLQVGFF